ncbi:MAG: flagellar hook-basal body complex protein FliE [Planctomycetales bacterium]
MQPIGGMDNLQTARLTPLGGDALAGTPPGSSAFKDLLFGSLHETADLQKGAEAAAEAYLAGEDITQAEVFTAMKKADIALKMLLQIRNRTLQAYNEIKDLRM